MHETVRHELSGQICRCTGYANIVKAIVAAGQEMPPRTECSPAKLAVSGNEPARRGAAAELDGARPQNPFGKSFAHFARMRSSSALLERATFGNVFLRRNGMQASMITREFRRSSAVS